MTGSKKLALPIKRRIRVHDRAWNNLIRLKMWTPSYSTNFFPEIFWIFLMYIKWRSNPEPDPVKKCSDPQHFILECTDPTRKNLNPTAYGIESITFVKGRRSSLNLCVLRLCTEIFTGVYIVQFDHSPPPPFWDHFFSPTNKFAAGGAITAQLWTVCPCFMRIS